MKKIQRIIRLSLFAAIFSYPCFAHATTVTSPDTLLSVAIKDSLELSITRSGKSILLDSPVGIVIDKVDLRNDVRLLSAKPYTIDETYGWHGNHSNVRNLCNGTILELQSGDQRWKLDLRAYNDGVAFKFAVETGLPVQFNGESTSFRFDPSWEAKYMRHSMAEENWVRTVPITEIAQQKYKRTLPPFLAYPQDQSHYVMLLEGGGFNFHGYSLVAQDDATFKVDYAEEPDGWKIDDSFETAWKIICTVDDLDALVNTDLVHNVCPAPDPQLFPNGIHEPWIRPGKSTWNWWAKISCEYDKQIELIDLAAQMKADYHLVDIGWDQKWGDDTKTPYEVLRELCDYAATKNMQIWVWKTSDVSLNLKLLTTEKRKKFAAMEEVQISLDVDEMRAEVKRIADAGAVGIKLDYIQSENSKWKTYMENFLKVCAEHQLMVDFHGCATPAGESRTYPNEVTREAIAGGEKLRGSTDGAKKVPTAQYIDMLFTRMIAGHADYTPTIFVQPQGKGFTHAMQLATAMMFTSPLLCWADHPEQYLASAGLEIIQTLPTIWDETRVLEGTAFDQLAVFARRKGTDWYVAGINGYANNTQSYALHLDFLNVGTYEAFICQDNMETESYPIQAIRKTITQDDTLDLTMLPSGGFILRITQP